MFDERLWKECAVFHGHMCPGLAMGFHATLMAMDRMGINLHRAGDEGLVCISENDACGVDAVQWITGCTTGKGNMIIHLTGKFAWSFYDRSSGKSIRIVMKPMDLTGDRTETMNRILHAPDDEIYDTGDVKEPLPEHARIFRSVVCSECGEAAREDLIRLQDGKFVCLQCFNEYKR